MESWNIWMLNLLFVLTMYLDGMWCLESMPFICFILVTSMEIWVIDIKIGVIAKKAWTYVKQGVTGLGFIMIKIDETGK